MTDLKKDLYHNPEKIAIISEVLHSYLDSMDKFNTLDGE